MIHKKPHPEIYLLTASKLGVEPSSCVVIEDAINGVQAARAAGMKCIVVTHSFSEKELKSANPDVVYDSITEVYGQIQTMMEG